MYEQKDIVLIPFPYSDLTESKKRPALIISNKKLNKTEDRICCLITSKPRKEDLEINNEHFEKGELPFKSYVRPHRIFTINEKIVLKKLCSVNGKFHKRLIREIEKYIR